MEPTKIRRISQYYRSMIDRLHEAGASPLNIHKKILLEDNVSITTRAIKLYICRRAEVIEGRMEHTNTHRSNRNREKLKDVHLRFIDKCMEEDDQMTGPELHRKLKDHFELDVSVRTVKRARQRLGWTATSTAYCQIVRDVNKEKRKLYCQQLIKNNETFDDVIFTDESTVKIEANVRQSFRRRGCRRRLRGVPKHPYQVHVWGGISRRGATEIAIFTGRMISEGYQSILHAKFLPFVKKVYPDGHRLYQDNDPKHTSKATRKWLEENRVTTVAAPPESPDLNPIEMVWGVMKRYLRRTVRPRTKEDLVRGISTFWSLLTPQICCRYIDHLYKVVPKVIQCDGQATGE